MVNKKGILLGITIVILAVIILHFLDRDSSQVYNEQPFIATDSENRDKSGEQKKTEYDLDIGKPSEGTDHIYQEINPENPYTDADEQVLRNFNKTREAQVIALLIDNLNSPEKTKIEGNIAGLALGEVHMNTTISEDFQGMLRGYRLQDSKERLLFDGNIIKNFQPHNDLLKYLQTLRSDTGKVVERIGLIIPEWDTGGSNITTITVDGEDKTYLLQRMKGAILLRQTDAEEERHYTASYNIIVGTPRGEDSESLPSYVWPQDLKIELEFVKEEELSQVKKEFSAE